MSIWNDCAEHNASPYFGYPIQVDVVGDTAVFTFPKGYCDMERFKLETGRFGTEIIEATDKRVIVRLNSKLMANVIYKALFEH